MGLATKKWLDFLKYNFVSSCLIIVGKLAVYFKLSCTKNLTSEHNLVHTMDKQILSVDASSNNETH